METKKTEAKAHIWQEGNKCYLEIEIPGDLAAELNAYFTHFDYAVIWWKQKSVAPDPKHDLATMRLVAKVKDPRA